MRAAKNVSKDFAAFVLQAQDGIRDRTVTGVQTCALPIFTYAGTGEARATPDGAQVAGTPLNGPRTIEFDPKGNLYLALREGNAIYRVDAKTERIYHVAGTGENGYAGDGGPARQSKLSGPKGLAYSTDGSLYIADTENHAIRRLDLKTGEIRTVL